MRQFCVRLTAISLALFINGCAGGGDPSSSTDGDVTATDALDASTGCPDGLVFNEEYGVCAPELAACEHPWEMPTVEGECVAVGPRACPKTWDPDADVDCEAGELLPCREGFVLTEDEVACVPYFDDDCGEMEIPVLGGGCHPVGPAVDPPIPPVFDECGSGELALPGGGCVLVGPRACPKLWDPDAEVDCEVGDVLPCPDGWVEVEDGLYCEPIFDECGTDQRPLLGGGCERIVPLAADCPAGPFPGIPEDATGAVYVLAGSDCTVGCGSAAAPFPSIQASIDAAPAGAAVLVGPGTYDEALVIQEAVQVVGLCSAQVMLTGEADHPDLPPVAILVHGVDGVRLSGLHIVATGIGVSIEDAANAILEGLDIEAPIGAGVRIRGAQVTAQNLWIHGGSPHTESGLPGNGIHVSEGSGLTLAHGLLSSTRSAAIFATGTGTNVALSETMIRNTKVDVEGIHGHGVFAEAGASVSMDRVLLDGNRHAQVKCQGQGTQVLVENSTVRDGQPVADGTFGRGLDAREGCLVEVSGSLLKGNRLDAVIGSGLGTKVRLDVSVVATTGAGSDGNSEGGCGVWIQEGAELEGRGLVIDKSIGHGMVVVNLGASVTLAGMLLRDVHPGEGTAIGRGIEMAAGALHLSDSVLEGCFDIGLAGFDSGTTIDLARVTVRGSGTEGDEQFRGINIQEGAALAVEDSLIETVSETGFYIVGEGSTASVQRTAIRGVVPSTESVGTTGESHGVEVAEGATATLTDVLVEHIEGCGGIVSHAGTQVLLESCTITDIQGHEGELGSGLQVFGGASLSIAGSSIEEATEAGVLVAGSGTTLEVEDVYIHATRPGGEFGNGIGVQVFSGAAADLRRVWISQSTKCGISVVDAGSAVTVADSVIRETLAKPGREDLDAAPGIEIQKGGAASVERCRIGTNRTAGIKVIDPGSSAEIIASLITDTLAGGPQQVGRGVAVSDGATASISESLIAENTEVGVFAIGTGAEVAMTASIVRDTATNPYTGSAYGIGVFEGASFTGLDLWITENPGGGIVVQDAGSAIELRRSVVLDSLPVYDPRFGDSEAFGRGVDLQEAEAATIEACLIQGNTAAGVRMMSEDGTLAVRGTIIRETRHHESGIAAGWFGMGLVAMGGAQAEVAYCLVDDNNTAGVACHNPGTSLRVRRSALVDTHGGQSWYDPETGEEVQEAFGDGAYVVDGGELVIEDSVIARNKRTGLYFSKSAGKVEGSVIYGNGSYGIAVDDPYGLVEYQDGENLVFGNALDLPTPEAQQTTTAPGGIPLPDVSEWGSWD